MITTASIQRANRPGSPRVPATISLLRYGNYTVIHLQTVDGLALEIRTVLPSAAVRPADKRANVEGRVAG